MNILLLTTEATPLAKTGGLADVCGALPRELERLGHDATVIMPAFRSCFGAGQPIEDTGIQFSVPIGSRQVTGSLLRTRLPLSNVPVFLVRNDAYYDRPELYREGGRDYVDNCERFVFFCRAAVEAIRLLELRPDVVHANDWQTALVPAYLATEYRGQPHYERIASLLTIHNLAYQGSFWHWDMLLTGMDWRYFNWQQMEFHGQLNLLKTGLVFADALSTVSPRYAEEIQSPTQGCGLEGVLSARRDDLTGILNGIDYQEWNPAVDPHLAARFDDESFVAGRAACKGALQNAFGLGARPDVPLIGFVGRLADQKGIDLIAQVMQNWLESEDVQWAILGTGEPQYHELLTRLAKRNPQKLGVRLEFSDKLAHMVEAGCDMFVMPSRYEPCGLNQLYSLRYGAVPIVRATGGLADTVVDAQPEAFASGTANGFSFDEYHPDQLLQTLERARRMFEEDRASWHTLIRNGMRQDWSWTNSAKRYVALYERLVAAR